MYIALNNTHYFDYYYLLNLRIFVISCRFCRVSGNNHHMPKVRILTKMTLHIFTERLRKRASVQLLRNSL